MKNLFLNPTDKPSRIYKSKNEFFTTKDYIKHSEESERKGQNIYITSDLEIKEGDWLLNETYNIEKAIPYYNYKSLSNDCKKIILTTDQELIKDGVQAIDDDFLQWFVKNPSCEEVMVDKFISGRYFCTNPILPKEQQFKHIKKMKITILGIVLILLGATMLDFCNALAISIAFIIIGAFLFVIGGITFLEEEDEK